MSDVKLLKQTQQKTKFPLGGITDSVRCKFLKIPLSEQYASYYTNYLLSDKIQQPGVDKQYSIKAQKPASKTKGFQHLTLHYTCPLVKDYENPFQHTNYATNPTTSIVDFYVKTYWQCWYQTPHRTHSRTSEMMDHNI